MKHTIILLLFMIGIFHAPASAQMAYNSQQRSSLKNLAQKLRQKFSGHKDRALKFAKKHRLPITGQSADGVVFEIQCLLDSIPLYYTGSNLNAAKTISTDDLWPGGAAGLNLSGSGYIIGEWDAGAVYPDHQEYAGRVTQKDNPLRVNSHSTAVAGTLIAGGIVAQAKGMAPAAMLNAYDWNNDYSEVTEEASEGLLVSNHSYSILAGWGYGDWGKGTDWYWWGDLQISGQESFYFGWYNEFPQHVDSIAVEAPYFLMVWPAGNNRNEGPASGVWHWAWDSQAATWLRTNTVRPLDGPYDCITGGGLAKNCLTIGAVNDILHGYTKTDDVVMTTFSGWGPCDDGRIKPDLVANGVSLNTTGSTAPNQYVNGTGTSFSTPSAAGSLLLLQQHYFNIHHSYMRSATLKALVIHSADEAGAQSGPDYQYGWGLLNAHRAADLISLDTAPQLNIQELCLQQEPIVLSLYSDGTQPIKATIAWTDPPGTIDTAHLDGTTPKLVNDLDIVMERLPDGVFFRSWILDPAQPQNAATTGDNIVDNIEQIFINAPVAAHYALHISHKGVLRRGTQDFSLILTGVRQSPVQLTARIFLEGATGPEAVMKTYLRDVIPANSPYPQASAQAMIDDSIVDWILLELRETSTATPCLFKSVLLRNDGYLIDAENKNPSLSLNIPMRDYYIIVRHRNHLACMSKQSVYLSYNVVTYDFTSGPAKYYDDHCAQVMSNGFYGAVAGDGNQSGGVYGEDYGMCKNAWNAGGYLAADFTMDGQVTQADLTLYFANQGAESRLP